MSEKEQANPRPGYAVLNPPVDTGTANLPFKTYFNTEQDREFENTKELLRRNQRDPIIALRGGFKKADGTVAKAGEAVSVIEAGGAANASRLESIDWLSRIDPELVAKRQAALTAELILDPAGPAVVLPSGIAEPGAAITKSMCSYQGESRTIYEDNGSAKQVPMGPPSTDGEALLQQLIESGRVVPGPGHKGSSAKAQRRSKS